MRESDLSRPIMTWLRGRGFTPYAEIPPPYASASIVDIVGVRGEEIVAVELKRSLTRRVVHQAYTHQLFAHQVWVAVGTRPRKKSKQAPRQEQIGVLSVRDGVVYVVRHASYRENFPLEHYARRMREKLAWREPGGTAGVPCLKGVGPAQDCYDRVQEFKREHPKATWQEIFEKVPNHYASARSMAYSMGVVRDKRPKRGDDDGD